MTSEHTVIDNKNIGYHAMRLAMTRTMADENAIKTEFSNALLSFVVTEVGGNTKRDFQEKASKAILGAAINSGIIKKLPHELHALLHAAEEAKHGVILNASSESNLAVKIAIVRTDRWIAVAMFGESAIHPLTSHERCGLGVMHIL